MPRKGRGVISHLCEQIKHLFDIQPGKHAQQLHDRSSVAISARHVQFHLLNINTVVMYIGWMLKKWVGVAFTIKV